MKEQKDEEEKMKRKQKITSEKKAAIMRAKRIFSWVYKYNDIITVYEAAKAK